MHQGNVRGYFVDFSLQSVEEFLTLATEQSHEGDDGDSTGTSGDGDSTANSDDMEEQDSASVSLADSDVEDEQRVLDEGEGGKDGEIGGDRDVDFIVLDSDDGGEVSLSVSVSSSVCLFVRRFTFFSVPLGEFVCISVFAFFWSHSRAWRIEICYILVRH